jgi:hypothetical protein
MGDLSEGDVQRIIDGGKERHFRAFVSGCPEVEEFAECPIRCTIWIINGGLHISWQWNEN